MPSVIKFQNGPSRLAKDVFPEVFKKERLRKDIVIYRIPNLPYAAALGTIYKPVCLGGQLIFLIAFPL